MEREARRPLAWTFRAPRAASMTRPIDSRTLVTGQGPSPGAVIPLAMSKWTAKRLSGARVIVMHQSTHEAWLVARIENCEKMIAALRRLQKVASPQPLPDQMAAFGISGSRGVGMRKLFMTHPPLEERIEALTRSR